MKVAFISNIGKGEYLGRLKLMKEVKKNGFDVSVIIPKSNYNEVLKKEGINVIHYSLDRGINPLKQIKTLYELFKIFKKENFSVVHSFTPKLNIYTSLAGKFARVPFIINHVTGLGYVFTEEKKSLRIFFLKILLLFLNNLAFNLATKIIFQNEEDFKYFRIFNKSKKILIKGSGVDIEKFNKNKINIQKIEELKNKLNIKNDAIVITFIGRLLEHKGIKEFVSAGILLSKKYQNLIFLIIGEIDRENPSAVSEEFVESIKKRESFRLIERYDDIENIYFITDIYVLPSYREGMPRTVIEAMAMEKPIVTTNTIGCRETVCNGVEGFLVPLKDTKELSNAIEKLVINKNLREKMGKNARKRVLCKFSDKIVFEKIIKIYSSLKK